MNGGPPFLFHLAAVCNEKQEGQRCGFYRTGRIDRIKRKEAGLWC